jgi:hypothetical protein
MASHIASTHTPALNVLNHFRCASIGSMASSLAAEITQTIVLASLMHNIHSFITRRHEVQFELVLR